MSGGLRPRPAARPGAYRSDIVKALGCNTMARSRASAATLRPAPGRTPFGPGIRFASADTEAFIPIFRFQAGAPLARGRGCMVHRWWHPNISRSRDVRCGRALGSRRDTGGAQAGARLAGPARQGARAPRGDRQLPEVPRAGPQGLAPRSASSCHKPIAERIAAKKGVHRNVTDRARAATPSTRARTPSFGRSTPGRSTTPRKPVSRSTDATRRSPATARAATSRGRSSTRARLARRATRTRTRDRSERPASTCHTTAVPFADARRQFDHAKARFPLTGAHRTVECAKCHVNSVFTGLKFAACTDCHREPHRQAFGADCTSCHTTDTWRTRKVDHARTAFPADRAPTRRRRAPRVT